MNLFFVENKYIQRIEEWGDYGYTLWSGFADKDDNGDIFIERAGPFTPDIYLTLDFLICTEKIKSYLEDSDMRGIGFRPARKQKLVRVDWQSYPPDADIFDILPDVNDPEELITKQSNDGNLLELMPEYFAIQPKSSIKIRRIAPYKYKSRHSSIEAYDVGGDLSDIVSADTHGGYFVTDRGREIFERIGGEFLKFIPLKIAA